MNNTYPRRSRATQILVLCCAFWAISFPGTKALQMLGEQAVPGVSSVFLSAWCVILRFGIGAVVVAALAARHLGILSRSEFKQGLGLGVLGGLGLCIQLDGLAYTSASTSAFLTQAYCIIIPIWLAIRRRRWPHFNIWIACTLAVIGALVLTGVTPRNFELGRGEWETLLSSLLFCCQILWLEKREFAGNNVFRFSFIMFLIMTLCCLPVACLTSRGSDDFLKSYSSPSALILIGVLIAACTLFTFLLMNQWQREMPATEAGLLYCVEPVFTAIVSLWLPGLFSTWFSIDYPNERATWNLILGGALILGANAWLQIHGSESESPE